MKKSMAWCTSVGEDRLPLQIFTSNAIYYLFGLSGCVCFVVRLIRLYCLCVFRLAACSVLMKYLTDTSVSPLSKEFVEIPDPYASKVKWNCFSYLFFYTLLTLWNTGGSSTFEHLTFTHFALLDIQNWYYLFMFCATASDFQTLIGGARKWISVKTSAHIHRLLR